MQAGKVVGDRFRIDGLAGTGGVGAVYRATDLQGDRAVALKMLRVRTDPLVERFRREAEVLAQLTDPTIVRYVTHGLTKDGELYLAMEWLDGLSLDEVLKRRALSVEEVLALAERVGSGLGVAHDSGIVHRDVKPSNLFLPGGEVAQTKILDFGIARLCSATRALTHSGMILGTPGYLSPEQARGHAVVDARADVFALGCVLFRCLTGRRVFDGDDMLAVLAKLVVEEAPRLRELREELPDALEDSVARMLAKSVEERPRDGAAVVEEVRWLRARSNVSPVAAPVPATLTTAERRLVCVILVRPPQAEPGEPALELSLPSEPPGAPPPDLDALAACVAAPGARCQPLADGSFLITVARSDGASDLVGRAARSALAIRRAYPAAGVALAAGRAVLGGRLPVGEVIDRAVRLLRLPAREGTAPEVRVDEVAAGLLDPRFDVGGDADALTLIGEREGGERVRTVLGRSTPIVGRERELATLEGLYDACTAATGVLITAPAGVGKSRLKHDFLVRIAASARPPEVWVARGDPMTAHAPFAMLGRALRAAAHIRDGEPSVVKQRKLRARLERRLLGVELARISEFIGELSGVRFSDDTSVQLGAARSDAVLMGDQIARAWIDLLEAECSAQPLILVLEDMHWGDLPSLRLIERALRGLRDHPLFVLALAKPDYGKQFPGLFAGCSLIHLRLHQLTPAAAERLVHHVLGDHAPREIVERVVELAAGNAFYLEELIRAVHEGSGASLPETVLAMVQSRLDQLPARVRRLLRAASVFGRVFWRGAIATLLGEQVGADLDRILGDLAEREIVTRRSRSKFAGEEELAFTHELFYESAYATLTDEDRVVAHRLAGTWLAAAGETEPMILAEHFERGAAPAQAAPWFLRAAEQALEGNDLPDAVARAARGISCAPPPAERAALLLVQAEAHGWQGDFVRQQACAMEALQHSARGSSVRFEAIGNAALATGKLGDTGRLVVLARLLLEELDPELVDAAVVAVARVAQRLLVVGHHEDAEALRARVGARLSAIAESAPDAAARMHLLDSLRAVTAGDAAANIAHLESAVAALERIGNLRLLASARGNLGSAYADIGQHAKAEAVLLAALDASDRMGLPGPRALAGCNLGRVYALVGKVAEARGLVEEAVSAYEELGSLRMAGASRIYLATILDLAGDLAGAEREARAAATMLAAVPPVQAYALATLARVLLHAGRVAEAQEPARRAAELLAELGTIDVGEEVVRLVLAQALERGGDRDGARVAIEAARDRLVERAALIGDHAARQSFLYVVPDHARTLELANALVPPL